MKVFSLFFLVYLTDASLLSGRIVQKNLDDFKKNLTASGLDPYRLPRANYNFSLPDTDLLVANLTFGGVEVKGISNIKLNSFRYLVTLANFAFSVPAVSVNIEHTDAVIKLMDYDLRGGISGSAAITGITASGQTHLRTRIFGGITVTSAETEFSFDNISSNLKVTVMDQDYSDIVNTFLKTTLRNSIIKHKDKINRVISYFVMKTANNR